MASVDHAITLFSESFMVYLPWRKVGKHVKVAYTINSPSDSFFTSKIDNCEAGLLHSSLSMGS